MQTITTTKKAFDAGIYNIRYKYGYDWRCYQNLASKINQLMADNKECGKKIIDIGCGVGWFTDMCYFNISRDIVGIDFSRLAIMFHARRMYPSIKFDIADMYDYDYKEFEVCILTEVLEHTDNDIQLLEKLSKNSHIYATVPFEKEAMDITHMREYTINSVAERYGKLIELKTCEKVDRYIMFWGIKK